MELEKKSSKFRLSAKKLLLTYRDYIDKNELFEALSQFGEIKYCKISWEEGETGYKHTHALIWYVDAINTQKSNFFDLYIDDPESESIHPNITVVSKGWKNRVNYLSKQDDDPFVFGDDLSVAKRIWDCKNIQEALTEYGDWRNPMAIKTYWENRPLPEAPKLNIKLRQWQQELFDYLNGPADDRKIIWYIDPDGGHGKSTFVDYMDDYDRSKYAWSNDVGGYKNFANLIFNTLKDGWTGHCWIVDFMRADKDYEIYKPLEALKDGKIVNQKYNCQRVRFPKPHVVCFSNWYPKVKAFSSDRWIFRLLKNGVSVSITLTDVETEWYIENIGVTDAFIPNDNNNNNKDVVGWINNVLN